MCLETKWLKPRVAKEDITVYKTLRVETQGPVQQVWSKGGIIAAHTFILRPYSYTITRKIYQIGKLNRVTDFGVSRSSGITYVNRGFHSFVARENAINIVGGYCVAVECKIPKGSLYWLGTNNGTSAGYCSNKLIIVKQIG